jgi:hypothetical protein
VAILTRLAVEGPTTNFSTRLKCRMSMEFQKIKAVVYLKISVSPPKGACKLICGMGPTSLQW